MKKRALILAISLGIAYGAPAYAESCLSGCPKGASDRNTEIVRNNYTLSNNPQTKFADWVAYKVVKSAIGKDSQRNWAADPDLAATDTFTPAEYERIRAVLDADRGHQAPIGSFMKTAQWATLNYMSNITPQGKDLNQGPWKALEDAERVLAKQSDIRAVYVVTGPLYEKTMPKMPNTKKPHTVPSGYWKVVALDGQNGIVTAAFIMHQDAARRADYCNFVVTIEDIEERSGLRLFSELSKSQHGKLSTQAGALVEQIGCEFINTESGGTIRKR